MPNSWPAPRNLSAPHQNPLALAKAYRRLAKTHWRLAKTYRRVSKTHRRPATTHRTPPNCFAVSPKPMAADPNLIAGRQWLRGTRQWLSASRRNLAAARQCLAPAPQNLFPRGDGFRRGSETFQGAGKPVVDRPDGDPEALKPSPVRRRSFYATASALGNSRRLWLSRQRGSLRGCFESRLPWPREPRRGAGIKPGASAPGGLYPMFPSPGGA